MYQYSHVELLQSQKQELIEIIFITNSIAPLSFLMEWYITDHPNVIGQLNVDERVLRRA